MLSEIQKDIQETYAGMAAAWKAAEDFRVAHLNDDGILTSIDLFTHTQLLVGVSEFSDHMERLEIAWRLAQSAFATDEVN